MTQPLRPLEADQGWALPLRQSRQQENDTVHTDWSKLMGELRGPLRDLRTGAPDVMKGFSAIAQAATRANALDQKTKELIALAIAVAIRCDDCIAFHTRSALERGADREEVLEADGMAVVRPVSCLADQRHADDQREKRDDDCGDRAATWPRKPIPHCRPSRGVERDVPAARLSC